MRAVSQLPPSVVEAPPAPILPSDDVILYGMRLESAESPAEYDEAGVPELLAGTKATFRLFGSGWTNQTVFALTASSGHRNGYCEHPKDEVAKVGPVAKASRIYNNTASIKLIYQIITNSSEITLIQSAPVKTTNIHFLYLPKEILQPI